MVNKGNFRYNNYFGNKFRYSRTLGMNGSIMLGSFCNLQWFFLHSPSFTFCLMIYSNVQTVCVCVLPVSPFYSNPSKILKGYLMMCIITNNECVSLILATLSPPILSGAEKERGRECILHKEIKECHLYKKMSRCYCNKHNIKAFTIVKWLERQRTKRQNVYPSTSRASNNSPASQIHTLWPRPLSFVSYSSTLRQANCPKSTCT